jgi:hypothetical protein
MVLLFGKAAVAVLALTGSLAHGTDRDGDGVGDELEKALLERFRPRFLMSAHECGGLPAEFQAASAEPRVLDRNGTLYARAFPSEAARPHDVALELHYYHLWEEDCGPFNPHRLDVEHVSTLVTAQSFEADTAEWVAQYWYAAAHEGTVCDTSNAARAEAIGAKVSGPRVWISEGKHASYLSDELCGQRGCGGDRCRDMTPMPVGPLINIGEVDRPLAGATWIASGAWPLAQKLGSDFDTTLRTRLEEGEPTVHARVNGQWRTTQFSLSVGGDVLGALGTAEEQGGRGVAEAEQQTQSALGRTFRAVGRALARVIWLGAGTNQEADRSSGS